MSHWLRETSKSLLGPHWTTVLRCLARGKELPRWGNLRRTQPFSVHFGADRGTPVDRYYIERFFSENREHIRGHVLEIQSSGYTRRYGHGVQVAHSVDVNPAVSPTVLCDLADPDQTLESNWYDCFLMPSTPQHLRQLEPALRHALRVVKPGGVILATCAAFVPLIPDGPDYWHLSAAGWEEVTQRVWPGCEMRVRSHGNCLAAVAVMLGLAMEEMRTDELDIDDPRYPVVVTLWCRKPSADSA